MASRVLVGTLLAGAALFGVTCLGANIQTPQAGVANAAAAIEPAQQTIADQVAHDNNAAIRLWRMEQEDLQGVLKDPDGAKYARVSAYSYAEEHGMVHFCGLINAKNGFGAYTGYKRFIASPNVGSWFAGQSGFKKLYREMCSENDAIATIFS